jgi:hypothetical protein
MNDATQAPIALAAAAAPERNRRSTYPEPFLSRMGGRTKRPLGDLFGLRNFGVNLTTLAPGGESARFIATAGRTSSSTSSTARSPSSPTVARW